MSVTNPQSETTKQLDRLEQALLDLQAHSRHVFDPDVMTKWRLEAKAEIQDLKKAERK